MNSIIALEIIIIVSTLYDLLTLSLLKDAALSRLLTFWNELDIEFVSKTPSLI